MTSYRSCLLNISPRTIFWLSEFLLFTFLSLKAFFPNAFWMLISCLLRWELLEGRKTENMGAFNLFRLTEPVLLKLDYRNPKIKSKVLFAIQMTARAPHLIYSLHLSTWQHNGNFRPKMCAILYITVSVSSCYFTYIYLSVRCYVIKSQIFANLPFLPLGLSLLW